MTNEFYIDQRVLHVPQNVVSTKGIRQMPRSNQIWTLRAVLGLHPIRWWRLADLYFGGGHKNLWNARKDIMAMSELRSRTRASEFGFLNSHALMKGLNNGDTRTYREARGPENEAYLWS